MEAEGTVGAKTWREAGRLVRTVASRGAEGLLPTSNSPPRPCVRPGSWGGQRGLREPALHPLHTPVFY